MKATANASYAILHAIVSEWYNENSTQTADSKHGEVAEPG